MSGRDSLVSPEIHSIVAAWHATAVSRDTMTELFRRGEVLPEGRNVQEEERLIASEKRPVVPGKMGTAVH